LLSGRPSASSPHTWLRCSRGIQTRDLAHALTGFRSRF